MVRRARRWGGTARALCSQFRRWSYLNGALGLVGCQRRRPLPQARIRVWILEPESVNHEVVKRAVCGLSARGKGVQQTAQAHVWCGTSVRPPATGRCAVRPSDAPTSARIRAYGGNTGRCTCALCARVRCRGRLEARRRLSNGPPHGPAQLVHGRAGGGAAVPVHTATPSGAVQVRQACQQHRADGGCDGCSRSAWRRSRFVDGS